MTFVKSLKERKRALDAIHSPAGWYALLISDDPTVVNISSVDTSTDTITATGHDFVNGTRVTVANVGGSLPGGLVASTEYRVINVSGDDFNLCTEASYNPTTKTGTAIDLTSAGSGTNTITESALNAKDDFDVWVRKEVPDYYGSERQSLTIPAGTINYTQQQVTAGPVNATFMPTSGVITFRYFAVISGGTGTRGNSTGTLAGFEDYVFTQAIDSGGKIFQYGVII